MNEFTDKGVYGDHALGFELAERHVNRPLIGPGGAKAVVGQIGALTDAHAGVANQQKDIATQMVAGLSAALKESTARAKRGASGCWSGGRRARFMRRSWERDECAELRRAHTEGRRLVG